MVCQVEPCGFFLLGFEFLRLVVGVLPTKSRDHVGADYVGDGRARRER